VPPRDVTSPSNPLLTRLRRQRRDPGAYRASGDAWLEGDHLAGAWLSAGRPVRHAVVSQGAWALPHVRHLLRSVTDVIRVPDAQYQGLSPLESPAGLGLVVPVPGNARPQPGVASLVLDRLQDPGNVGSLLRSAAALGFGQVLALTGTVALWSPKVLRAGMGAHAALSLVEGLTVEQVADLGLPLVATSPRAPSSLPDTELPWPLAWVLGHEGQGLDPELQQRCGWTVSIPQPGGQESLNVAAAGAICLYASACRRVVATDAVPPGR
jgi:TrmH family RNA methyltransferase